MRWFQIVLVFICTQMTLSSNAQSSIDFVVGLDRSYRNLVVDNDDYALELVKSARDESNKAKVNWRIGMNYNHALCERFVLKSGIRLTSVGYYLKKTNLRWGSQHDGMGDWDPSLPGSNVSYKLSEDHLFIEVPVAARFVIKKGKIQPFVELGIFPAFYLTTKRVTQLDDEKSVAYEAFDKDIIRKFQLVGSFSVGVDYRLNNGNFLFVQPAFRYHLNSHYDVEIKEYLKSTGVELGYRLRIK